MNYPEKSEKLEYDESQCCDHIFSSAIRWSSCTVCWEDFEISRVWLFHRVGKQSDLILPIPEAPISYVATGKRLDLQLPLYQSTNHNLSKLLVSLRIKFILQHG